LENYGQANKRLHCHLLLEKETKVVSLCRLIKEGICDKNSVPSVSAISRLLRGRDEEEVKKTSKTFLLTIKTTVLSILIPMALEWPDEASSPSPPPFPPPRPGQDGRALSGGDVFSNDS